ncbi:uncharacterized protein UTRI_10190 [Ustilago trichophora]|uniref:Phosphodiester glycosidase domain-containing protein n=1 Tax=Ustilago trichophora TaxID=86804 RepID=A0A5C3EEU2_9BASI|nr:uncharacterized protein UTRI_10190 [Ustilago trichophora]
MRWIQGAQLIRVFLGLAAVAKAAVPRYSVEFGKRMEGGSAHDDHIHFDQLHSRFFQHKPAANRPDTPTVLRMYPETYFAHGKPLFFADQDSHLSRAGLLQAYNLFGKVHVSNAEGTRHLTIVPDIGQFGTDPKPRISEPGLGILAAGFKTIENHYGRAVALVSQGADLGQEDGEQGLRFQTPKWTTVELTEPMPSSPFYKISNLRRLLKAQRYLLFTSQLNENIQYGVRLTALGQVQGRSFGDSKIVLREAANLLRP